MLPIYAVGNEGINLSIALLADTLSGGASGFRSQSQLQRQRAESPPDRRNRAEADRGVDMFQFQRTVYDEDLITR